MKKKYTDKIRLPLAIFLRLKKITTTKSTAKSWAKWTGLLNNVTISETMSTNCSGLPNNCTGPVSIQCDACLFGRPNCEKKYLFSEKKIESVSLMVWKCPRNLITWAIWNESLTIISIQYIYRRDRRSWNAKSSDLLQLLRSPW